MKAEKKEEHARKRKEKKAIKKQKKNKQVMEGEGIVTAEMLAETNYIFTPGMYA